MVRAYILVGLMAVSCVHSQDGSDQALGPEVQTAPENTNHRGWQPEYDLFVAQNLTSLQRSMKTVTFWQKFFRALSKAESNHNPKATFQENFNDRHGRPVISSGLFQVSLESGRAYKCPFRNQADLLDPLKNLKCGILIVDRWLGRDGVVYGKKNNKWQGGARYWSVLRNNGRSGHKRFLKEFL